MVYSIVDVWNIRHGCPSFFLFFYFRHQTVVARMVLRQVRSLGAIKGLNWQRSASRKEDARNRELEGALQILRMP